MRVIFVIGAIVIAVVTAALATDTSYAHGQSDFIEDESEDPRLFGLGVFRPIKLSSSTGAPASSSPQPRQYSQQAPNNPPTLTGTTAITYTENGTGPVATYTATDPENNQIVWSLSGEDGADFSIIRGALTFNAGPDYEDPTDSGADNVHHVTVEASDGANTVTLNVTVTVTNVDEAPQFPDSSTARSVADNTGVGEDVGAPVEATDPDGDSLTYALGGKDAASFDIATSTGQLLTKAALDSDSYSLTVSVSDGKDADGNVDTTTDDTIDVTISVESAISTSGSSQTVFDQSIPRQLVSINGGVKNVLLSDYFSDSNEGYPPYQAATSDSAIATVEVSNGYLTITPLAIGVATTTLTVTDTPGIREQFKTIVYRPVLPRTNTEAVHIVDPELETTLTSSEGGLTVTFPVDVKEEFFQAAIDPLSNNCGRQAPVGERRMCVLVDLFDLAAESVEESLNHSVTLSVVLNGQQYGSVQTDLANGDFSMWKGHGPTDTSWDEVPQCDDPRGQSECFILIPGTNGGRITVFNIVSFSQFAAGIVLPDPPVSQPPSTTPPTGNSGGGSSADGSSDSSSTQRSSTYEYRGNRSPQIFGQALVSYPENGTDAVAEFTVEDPDDDEITWSLLGHDRRKLEISNNGVLSFRSPPDYENSDGLRGNTYWVIVQAEDDGKPSEYDVHNVYVTVTQVNELGTIIGDNELSVTENQTRAIAQYQVEDPEKGVITWSLSGPDASGFKMDDTGNLSPAGDLDFENPSSAAESNVHVLTITATDDGQPELSAQLDVTVTISNVNEAPQVGEIPDVELPTRHMPWMLDLADFFTDPDGDSLSYEISGHASTDVAHAAVDGGTLSITPAGEGTASFYVVAADPGGLRVVGKVAVSVTDPAPAPTPVPAKVTAPVPTSTPAQAVVVDAETQSVEPSPTHMPLWQLSERRYRNLTQPPDSISKVIVAFAVEPVDEPMPELTLPPMATPVPARSDSDYVPATDVVAAPQGQSLSVEINETGGGLPIWLTILLILIAVLIVGYLVYMVVLHRVSEPLWIERPD